MGQMAMIHPSNAQIVPFRDVVNRFPDFGLLIKRLASADERFLELCRDYRDAAQTVERLAADDVAAPERVREYRELLEEMERDLRDRLNALA